MAIQSRRKSAMWNERQKAGHWCSCERKCGGRLRAVHRLGHRFICEGPSTKAAAYYPSLLDIFSSRILKSDKNQDVGD